jgi:predicted dienelactone hydrolase
MGHWAMGLALGLGTSLGILGGTTLPSWGADRLTAVFGPVELSVPVEDLEIYANTGRITDEFRPYARAATPEQLAGLRDVLQQQVDLSPGVVSQLVYTPTGATLLQRLGTVLQTGSGQNGFLSLRAAFVQGANSPEGLTLVSWLKAFPVEEIRVDLQAGLAIAQEAGTLFFLERQQLVEALQGVATGQAQADATDFSQLRDLRSPGRWTWRQQELIWQDDRRDRPIPMDLYWPDRPDPAPLVIISHGVGGVRYDFAYLARHLASHGFVVAVPEHVGSNAQLVRDLFRGLDWPVPREAIDRPLDITYVIDQLEQTSQANATPANSQANSQANSTTGLINFDQVGIIGQSLGGYTALAVGGAPLNPTALGQECNKPEPDNTSLNISLLLQCRIYDLFLPPDPTVFPPQLDPPLTQVNFQDPRIKAILAINPFTSRVFGPAGLGQIQVPVMIVASGGDIIVPPGPEQLYPFTWVTSPDRYLVLMDQGTHFSTIAPAPGQEVLALPPLLLGPDPTIAQDYTEALGLAFMGYHLTGAPEFQPYLHSGYAQFLSNGAMPLSLVRSLDRAVLDQALVNGED